MSIVDPKTHASYWRLILLINSFFIFFIFAHKNSTSLPKATRAIDNKYQNIAGSMKIAMFNLTHRDQKESDNIKLEEAKKRSVIFHG